jgi:hypothetical protein
MDIKCAACGHTKINSYDFDAQEYVNKGEDFIRIDGSFTIPNEDSYYYPPVRKVYLYACPICGTVKMIYALFV